MPVVLAAQVTIRRFISSFSFSLNQSMRDRDPDRDHRPPVSRHQQAHRRASILYYAAAAATQQQQQQQHKFHSHIRSAVPHSQSSASYCLFLLNLLSDIESDAASASTSFPPPFFPVQSRSLARSSLHITTGFHRSIPFFFPFSFSKHKKGIFFSQKRLFF